MRYSLYCFTRRKTEWRGLRTTDAGLSSEDLEAAGVDVAALQLRHDIVRALAEADSLLQFPAGYSVPTPASPLEASGT